MKIAIVSIALTLGVSLSSEASTLSALKERGKAAVVQKVTSQSSTAQKVSTAVKEIPTSKAALQAKKDAAVAAAKEKATAAAASKVTSSTATAEKIQTAVSDIPTSKAALQEKKDELIEQAKTKATEAAVEKVTSDSTTSSAVVGALVGSTDSTSAAVIGGVLGGDTVQEAATSAALSSIETQAKEALSSKFSSQQALIEQLSALKSGDNSVASVDSLKTAVTDYQKANSAWSLLEGQLSDTQKTTVESFFPSSDSLDSSIMTQAGSLLLQNKESTTPGLTDVLEMLAK